MTQYDYIIVGAGSAGCVLANRLSRDPGNSVLLLEAGGSDYSPFIRMPAALSYPMNMRRYNWGFESEPEPGLDDRRIDCPRGKVLGGSSSINGMVHVRGHASDFDEWQQLGADGWSYRDCLPYFRRMETWEAGADEYHGDTGPLVVQRGTERFANPLYRAFIDAGVEAGYGETPDYNGERQEGFGAMHMTVENGVRCSTSHAYLRKAAKRPNLQVLTRVLVDRILFDGRRATGISFRHRGQEVTAHCGKEVILCAGSIGSPTLLQRSGVGPAPVLQEAGVELVHELAGVGENLQDHLEVYFQYTCTQPITLNGKLGMISKALIGARWLLFRDGLGSTNHFESCAFIRSAAGRQAPDIQYHFLPGAMRYDGTAAFEGHGFQVHVGPNKPHSRGHVRIRSADPAGKPAIRFNYLQQAEDVRDWRRGIRLTREIIAQPAMDPYRGSEIQPGGDLVSDDDIDAWVRANVESAYHASCSCKMGAANDPLAVVDNACRVIGIEGLRVVDSSIFPSITNGNLNAPTIMTAEKASDLILGNEPLPPAGVTPWIDPEWASRQRRKAPLRPVDPV